MFECILILLYAALSGTAVPPRTSLHVTTSDLTVSTQSNDSTHPALNTTLESFETATRKLVRHDDLLHIRYVTHELLPSPLYRQVIQTSLGYAAEMLSLEGDDALLPDRYVHVEGNVLLMADHAHDSSSEGLTWGVLYEALQVVQRFMQTRPFHLEAEILGDLDGRGFRIGEIMVRGGPFVAGWKENVTTH